MQAKIISETIFYILNKLNQADKIQIVKLVYLADKYHLLRYGRTITGDRYFAVKHGPMGSMVDDVLNFNNDVLDDIELQYAKSLINQIDSYTYCPNAFSGELPMLSRSDKKCLDFIIERYGHMDKWKLRDYTHKFPEWKRYEKSFMEKSTSREDIATEDMLSSLPDDQFNIPSQKIEDARAILTGQFE
jgi:uncharacterized phage-associated protein